MPLAARSMSARRAPVSLVSFFGIACGPSSDEAGAAALLLAPLGLLGAWALVWVTVWLWRRIGVTIQFGVGPTLAALFMAVAGAGWVLGRGRPVPIADVEMALQMVVPAVVAVSMAFERVARAFEVRGTASWAPLVGLLATCLLAVPMALGVELPPFAVGCLVVLWMWGPISLPLVATIALAEWLWRRRSAQNTQAEHAMSGAVFVGLIALVYAGHDGGLDAPYRLAEKGVFACRVSNGLESQRTIDEPIKSDSEVEMDCRGPFEIVGANCAKIAAIPDDFYRCAWDTRAPLSGRDFELPIATESGTIDTLRLRLR